MKVAKAKRPFWSLFRDIGTTIFSYDFIYDNLSPPCVQASIDQWIGDWTCNLEVMGSNLPSDCSFYVLLFLIFFSSLFQKIFCFLFFSRFYTFLILNIVFIVHLLINMNL